MGYYEHLKEILAPLRLYDLNVGAGRAELMAIGGALDGVCDELETLEGEAVASTAGGYGLGMYEEIMPFVPAYQLESERRAAIEALLRIDGMAFTPEAINGTVAGCGIEAVVEEGGSAETVKVSIINTRGVPEDFSHIRERIEQILPCHLEVEYSFIYTTWSEFMGYFSSWQELETDISDWHGAEIYVE